MNESVDLIEMKIPAKPEYVGIIRLTLSGVASRMGYAYEEIEDLKLPSVRPVQMQFSMPTKVKTAKMERWLFAFLSTRIV